MSAADVITEALDAHYRTDCSHAPGDGTYWRWVKCRCGWTGARSQHAVNVPDLHRIWNGHIAERSEAALSAAGYVIATREQIRAWPAEQQAELIGGRVESLRTFGGQRWEFIHTQLHEVRDV